MENPKRTSAPHATDAPVHVTGSASDPWSAASEPFSAVDAANQANLGNDDMVPTT